MAGLPARPRRSPGSTQSAPSSAIEAARSNARAIALTLAESASTSIACRCSTSASQAPTTSSATARWAPSRCRSPRSAGRCSTAWPRPAWSASSSICPGHGRALVDSHKELPVVTAERRGAGDRPRAVRAAARGADGDDRACRLHRLGRRPAGEPVADRDRRDHPRPDRLRRLADDRRSRHGGAGRRLRRRAPRACVAAGCDVALHCSGKMDEMVAVADAVPAMIAGRRSAAGAGDGDGAGRRDDGADFAEAVRQARRAAGAGLTRAADEARCADWRPTTLRTGAGRAHDRRADARRSTAGKGRSTCC